MLIIVKVKPPREDKFLKNSPLFLFKRSQLDLQDFPIDPEPIPGENFPPMHPNCRCVIQPALDGETKDSIIRRGRDEGGKNTIMPPGMTYEEWKKEYVEKPEPAVVGHARVDANTVDAPLRGEWKREYVQHPISDMADEKEIAEYMKKNYAVNMEGAEKADIELLKASSVNMAKYLDDNKDVQEHLRTVRFTADKRYGIEDGTFGTANIVKNADGSFRSEINLNEKYYGNPNEFKRLMDSDPGYFVKGTKPEDNITHELAHCKQISASMRIEHTFEKDGKFVKTIGFRGMDERQARIAYRGDAQTIVGDTFRKNEELFKGDREQIIKTKISKYATKNSWETIAEALNDVQLNGGGASALSKKIYNEVVGYI